MNHRRAVLLSIATALVLFGAYANFSRYHLHTIGHADPLGEKQVNAEPMQAAANQESAHAPYPKKMAARAIETPLLLYTESLGTTTHRERSDPPEQDQRATASTEVGDDLEIAGTEPTEEEERLQIVDIVSELEQHHYSEHRDSQWADAAERDIAQGILNQFPEGESRLSDVECRSSLCRLEVAYESPEAEGLFLSQIGIIKAFANTEAYYVQADPSAGRFGTVIYVSRSEHRLPPLQRE